MISSRLMSNMFVICSLKYARTHLSHILEQFPIIYSHLFKLVAADECEKYGKFNIIDFWQLLFNLCENRKKMRQNFLTNSIRKKGSVCRNMFFVFLTEQCLMNIVGYDQRDKFIALVNAFVSNTINFDNLI